MTGAAWPRRVALLVIAALAGLSYAWALGRDPLEPYYAAAVRSMSMNWHNFFYGAFDPAGTISLDKLPGAFWVQALAVHDFGFRPWAIVLPQAGGNISDSLMILLLVLAADAVSAALASGSQGRLVLAAVWTGLAFQAKMTEAWLVLWLNRPAGW
jgi:4-amino-4-deoxy-L-arabinose transferase-like glycosyltransferase